MPGTRCCCSSDVLLTVSWLSSEGPGCCSRWVSLFSCSESWARGFRSFCRLSRLEAPRGRCRLQSVLALLCFTICGDVRPSVRQKQPPSIDPFASQHQCGKLIPVISPSFVSLKAVLLFLMKPYRHNGSVYSRPSRCWKLTLLWWVSQRLLSDSSSLLWAILKLPPLAGTPPFHPVSAHSLLESPCSPGCPSCVGYKVACAWLSPSHFRFKEMQKHLLFLTNPGAAGFTPQTAFFPCHESNSWASFSCSLNILGKARR